MIIEKIRAFEHTLINQCEKFTQNHYWPVLISLCLTVSVFFFSFPGWSGFNTENWQAIIEQCKDPLKAHNYPDYLHHSKLTFRLTIPLIAYVFNLGIPGILALQAFAGILLFYISAKWCEQMTHDRVTAVLLTILISFIYTGRASFTETRGMFDGPAILFLVAAMYVKHPVWIGMNVLLSSWTDERGLIASCLVFFYWSIQENVGKKEKLLAVGVAWITYFVMRYCISVTFGLKTSTGLVGWSVFVKQINNLPIGVWTALEGGWLLVALGLLTQYAHKKYFQMSAYAGGILIITSIAMSVIDITRSMAYVLPALFIAVSVLSRSESVNILRRCMLAATLISFIYPAYYVGSNYYSYWNYPLPLQILRYIFIL
jgi:hypothetical protein